MKYFLGFLFILLIGALGFTYFKIADVEITNTPAPSKPLKAPTFEKIKKIEFNSFELPAREIFFKVDLRNYKNVILYKIIINVDDKFTLFNVETLLDQYDVIYSLYQGKKIEIFMIFKNLKEASNIISLFKEYNFKIKIQKIKKRI